ncbi:NAD(P)+ transhydrogenase beta chain [Phreatobacter stygius]|uniref:NAD(P)+ transhydrogenase beta chain n=1 Tax=Phreatobacter stygius TaxID=1940610 RepID=A0A4D7B2W6_9HYPH|nr:NAD(P)+ transhydrogenase beta chain [Phreatobacter stygius]QCI65645.1 NAD(P)+ transhydrogenase beta chain [Phreatobacter stygius]
MGKPGYSLTRQAFWVSFVLAWCVILAIVYGALAGQAQAVALAPIVVPSMVLMIAALLGIHRAFGSMDMRAQAAAAASPLDKPEAG